MIRVALALIALAGVAHADMDALDVLHRVEATYKKPQQLTTSFDYTHTNALTGKISRSNGTLYVAKPDRIRFEYLKTKDGQTRIAVVHLFDGKTGWYVDHGNMQYAKQATDASQLPVAVTFFLGSGSLSKEFTPAFAATRTGTTILLELTPKRPSAAYAKVTLAIDNKDGTVTKTMITNSSGDTGEFVFGKLVQDRPAPAGKFALDPRSIAGYKRLER